MRLHILLLLSVAVAAGLPVHDWVPIESLGDPQMERNPLLADLFPEQGRVIQEDPKPVARKESFVQEEHNEKQAVPQDMLVKAKPILEAEANEVVKEKEHKEEPINDGPRDQEKAEQVENTPLLNVIESNMAEEEPIAEKPVMELEPVPKIQEVYQRNLNELVQEVEPEKQEGLLEKRRNKMQEKAIAEAEESVMVPKMQNYMEDEEALEAQDPVMDYEPVPDVNQVNEMNPNENVEELVMESQEILKEVERNAMQNEALLEAGDLGEEEPMMEMDPEVAERSAMLEGALTEPEYQMAEDTVLQSVLPQEHQMQEYLQKARELAESNMESLKEEEELMMSDQNSLMNKNFIREAPAATEEELVENTPSSNWWQTCTGVYTDGKCYQFFRGPKKAPDAEFFCQSNFPNGHLASVTSSYIHSLMMGLMDENGGRTHTWIGGLRYLDTGRFIWQDGAHWGYADWLPGEPNNTVGVENCVELLSNGKFNDMPCWDLRAFICSFPL